MTSPATCLIVALLLGVAGHCAAQHPCDVFQESACPLAEVNLVGYIVTSDTSACQLRWGLTCILIQIMICFITQLCSQLRVPLLDPFPGHGLLLPPEFLWQLQRVRALHQWTHHTAIWQEYLFIQSYKTSSVNFLILHFPPTYFILRPRTTGCPKS